MNKLSCSKQRYLVVACAVALGILTGTAQAQTSSSDSDKALWGNASAQVWKNASGECWHSAFGPPPMSAECDPNYKAPVAQVAPAPQRMELPVVAQAPPAAVAAKPAAKPPARQAVVTKVSLDADALFDFDKAVLRPEGRTELDGFVSKLAGVDIDKITAIGHTDRFGTDSYNQSLSERRADTVKAYLVAKGVRADRVQTQGMGEREPVVKATDCRGPKSVKVVACLQPDRRVDIDLVGSRTTQ